MSRDRLGVTTAESFSAGEWGREEGGGGGGGEDGVRVGA